MAEATITRADLSEAVYQEVGLSRNESADLVETVLNEISSALVRGEMVKLSSFGSFSVRQKGQRIGRNPKTGEEVPILPRRVLVFRASHVLKNRINKTLSSS
ncbi:integration host factor subunit alpha [Denitrobaculum tricleocarpae]|jgi:integration host factor subunit alpha|uniref:Integration host factor subunit alpha n=1 Tax=Denitrobaculum tricleocarpae TaxID=2591009 RepID=A0A545TTC0_9PROT|nr:integration host factor subunit alpha [Denitrobaculum tricleocarpae]TQV80469.1 integration host factor subunit alpha [Denitrobaculum tricleocarpae]